jgi:phage-related holin
MQNIAVLFATPQIKWILILVAIDVLLGVIAALLKKDFRLGKVAGFMKKGVLGYVLGFAVLEMVGGALTSLEIVVQVAYVLIILALVGSILNNLGKMGLPLPTYLKKE